MKIIRIVYLVFLFSLIIGQYGAVSIGPFANMFVHDIIVAILLIGWFVYSLFIRKKLLIPSIFLPISVFLLWALITLVLGGINLSLEPKEFLISSLFLVRLTAYVVVFVVAFDLAKEEPGTTQVFLKSLTIIAAVVSLIGILQVIFFPMLADVAPSFGWALHRGRLFSTFLDPNFVGAFIGINLISMLLLFKFKFKNFDTFKPFLYAALLISTPALSLTLSRSAWLLFTASSVVLGVFKGKFFWGFVLVFLISTLILIPRARERLLPFASIISLDNRSVGERIESIDRSALARIGSWGRGSTFFLERPLTGVGFNTLRYAAAQRGFFGEEGDLGPRSGAGVDSSILFLLATTGVIGFGIFFLVGVKILKDSFSAFRNKTSELGSFLGLLVFSTFIGLLLGSNFINSIFYPQIILWMLTVLGLFYATREKGIEITKIGDVKNYLRLEYKKNLRLIKQIKQKIQKYNYENSN